jgi:hypothetical protein
VSPELPCDLCGEATLEDFLEDVSDRCGRERLACKECVKKLDDEEREEQRANEFDERQAS